MKIILIITFFLNIFLSSILFGSISIPKVALADVPYVYDQMCIDDNKNSYPCGTYICGTDYPEGCYPPCPEPSGSCYSTNFRDFNPSDCSPVRTGVQSQGPSLADTLVCKEPPASKCSPPPAGTPITPMKMSDKGIKFLEKWEGKSSSLGKKFCSSTVTKGCRMDSNPYGFYNDIAGYCTVGIGHLVDKVNTTPNKLDCASIDKLPPSNPIKQHKDDVSWVKDKNDAYQLKSQDLPNYEKIINDNAQVQLTQEQFDALVSLAFNTEVGGKAVLKLINTGNCDPAAIASKFGEYNKITDKKTGQKVPNKGLTDRRTQEADIFNYGKY